MRRRGVLASLAAAAIAACTPTRDVGSNGGTAQLDAGQKSSVLPVPSARAPEARPADAAPDTAPNANGVGADAGADDIYATARAIGGKSIGHTSVVLKVKLEGGKDAAWKPRSKRGPLRYKGEIAAFRLGAALGLPNVPRAIPRSFPMSGLVSAMGGPTSDAGELLRKEGIPTPEGDLPGALIPWIAHLDFLALEADPLLSTWKGWLNGKADIPAEKQSLAAQISTLIVFDYLTGNWDRWSGGNIGWDKEHGMVLFIDNDGAFYEVPPPGPLEAQRGRLAALTHFSAGFVERLRRLDGAALGAALGNEDGGPLLSQKAVAGVVARRETALKLIGARIAASSTTAALSFE